MALKIDAVFLSVYPVSSGVVVPVREMECMHLSFSICGSTASEEGLWRRCGVSAQDEERVYFTK